MMLNTSDNTKNKGLACEANPSELLNLNNTSTSNQRQIILGALMVSAQSTINLRHSFGVMMPAARVKELRDIGYQIDTVRVSESTPDGIKHKAIAKYVLRGANHD